MSQKAHTNSEISPNVFVREYWGPHLKYIFTEDRNKKKTTLSIHKDGEELTLNGREIIELAKIF